MNQITRAILVLIVTCCIFCGCSKNNNVGPSKFSIVGKWSFVSDSVNTFVSTKLIYSQALNETASDYEQFNADGTGLISLGGSTLTFFYSRSQNGAVSTVSIDEPSQLYEGMTTPGTGVIATIKKLTSTELYLYSESIGYNNGITYIYARSEHFVKN